MTRTITVAAIQMAFSQNRDENIATITDHIHQAKAQGAQVVLPSELLEGHYFCKQEQEEFFAQARPLNNHPTVFYFQKLAADLQVVIPVSLFEKAGPAYYNSVVIIDADGSVLGVYRKSHIPDGPGYEEKYYFRPGDTGFKVWQTKYGVIGVGICWDQWFPECARAMALMGADVLLYPTAIGSEPHDPGLDTKDPWQRVMIGHAVANIVPVVAANRLGNEAGQVFYGSSFISDVRGDKVAELGREESGFITHTFDLDAIETLRAAFGFFRDRRTDLYQVLLSGQGNY